MNLDQAMRRLESMGAEQTRQIYRRHGAGENLFGVSFGNLGKLQKEIRTDHELAQQLWATGNVDARTLATMIADPAKASEQMLDRWARDLDYYCLVDMFARFVMQTPLTRKKMEQWTKSKEEWIGRAGWHLLGFLAMRDKSLPDRFFEAYLGRIEKTVHQAPNRTRDAMNGALIAIGIRNAALQKKALAAVARIGKVEVDHGETNCKTPDAASYIRKAWQRKNGRPRKAGR